MQWPSTCSKRQVAYHIYKDLILPFRPNLVNCLTVQFCTRSTAIDVSATLTEDCTWLDAAGAPMHPDSIDYIVNICHTRNFPTFRFLHVGCDLLCTSFVALTWPEHQISLVHACMSLTKWPATSCCLPLSSKHSA